MSATATAYLVVLQGDFFGAVIPLIPGQIYSLGRAASNRVILSGDKCSRIHAEIAYADEHWRVRDLNSANGTKVNSIAIQGDHELAFNDN